MKERKEGAIRPEPITKSDNLFPVVGIGASAGGLDAFKKLLKAIPEDSGMAYVLVQHLDPSHESMLPELLQKVTSLPVLEITDEIKVEPNHIYVIPSNKIIIATDGVLLLAARPHKSQTKHTLPIDLFFTSLAEVHQTNAIGVVLSGTATDGTLGLKAIKDQGGITFAQDEVSAAYSGMPHSAAQAGVVDFILSPEKIPQKLVELTRIIAGKTNTEVNLQDQDEDAFKQILALLCIRKGTDFTYYKQSTIRRRILRRMVLNKSESPNALLNFLKENEQEQDVLYQDLLIPVTSFFRDEKSFDNLTHTIFPIITKNKLPGEAIRIWVAGCSTGEEAYSLAICLLENLDNPSQNVQIFATDLSESAIAKARLGVYTKNELNSVSAERLNTFFTKTKGTYRVIKTIREMCVFALHNFLKDPPFGKMDLITCRNVLIYMEPYLQNKALTTFHYSLVKKGYLLLGKSETTGGVPALFSSAVKNDKIFSRKDAPGKFMQVASRKSEQNFSLTNNPNHEPVYTDFQKTADDLMLRKYTPAGVVVNEAADIVHFRGNTSTFLEQAPGKPTHNLLQLAKNGLAFELRNLLHKVKKDNAPVIKEYIPIEVNGSLRTISIEAMPLPNTIEPHYLILFHDSYTIGSQQYVLGDHQPKTRNSRSAKTIDKDLRIQQLEKELAQTREDMRSITEDQESANEELQSANEELLSSSEELQSLNEELETGKEELQSTNEELTIVNQETINLNDQLIISRNYSEAIILNIREPLLILDKTLRVKTANNAFYKTFRVNELETEGSLIYDLGNKQWDIPELRALLENILPEKSVFNDFEVRHTFSNIGERIMLLNAREVINKNSTEKLILLSIEDITERKKAQEVLNKTGRHFRDLVKELPAGVYSCDATGRINFYNDAAARIWGRMPEIGKDFWCGSFKIFKPDGTPISLDSCPMAISLKEGRSIMGEEIMIERPDGTRSNVLVYPQPEFSLSGEITGAINMVFDITEQVNARNVIEESEMKFRQMADLLPEKIWVADDKGNKDYFNQTLLDYTGLTLEELLAEGWEKLIHPDDYENDKKKWLHAIRTGQDYESENRLLRNDGVYLWHLTRAIPVKDEAGKIKMWVGAKTEIQDQKDQKEVLENSIKERTYELLQANEELELKNKEIAFANEKLLTEYSRSLIEASLDPLFAINPWGKITDINQATQNITGLSHEQLIGTNFFDYFTNPHKAFEVYEEVFIKGSVADSPLTLRHTDGKLTDVFFNGSVYKDSKGTVLGVVIVARDVTEQQRISKELTEAKVFAELATLIAEEAKGKAESATQIAEDAVKAKQQFLSNMSHEIRTPMNAIIGFTKVVLKTDLTAKQKEYLNAIKMSGDALIVLINDILDLAKVDSGKMTFEKTPFKLALSISAMLHLFETKIQEKNLVLVTEYDKNIPEVLVGDAIRLHQIILNLVSNAVKFTNTGKITVSIDLVNEDDESVEIEFAVSDTGIGIHANKMETIFDNFQQASSNTARLFGGTGLGLAIVKQLVEAQGGKINVESVFNEGSTFSFKLRYQKTKERAQSDPTLIELDSSIKNIKVLVVEDMALNQLLMKTLLDDFGFERDIAPNGKIAIEMLQTKSYDIVLMDLQMPEMNGFEATEYIRNTMNSKIPIIALTADVTTVDLAKCKAVGMNDYIAKPVDERILYSKIIGLVKKPVSPKATKPDKPANTISKETPCIDLGYLNKRTKSEPGLMMEMISIYLEQTPTITTAMKKALEESDWKSLKAAVHKLIPSFSIVGIDEKFEDMAKYVQENAGIQKNTDGVESRVLALETICEQACQELKLEYNRIKTNSI